MYNSSCRSVPMSGVQRTSRIAGPTGNEGKFSVTPMHMVQFVTLLAQGTMCGGVAEIFFQRLFMLASTTARLSRCQPHVLVRRFRQGSTPSPPLSLGVVRASQFTTHIAQDQHGSRGSTDHFCGSSFYAPQSI
jgi:hypothetical protein